MSHTGEKLYIHYMYFVTILSQKGEKLYLFNGVPQLSSLIYIQVIRETSLQNVNTIYKHLPCQNMMCSLKEFK